MRIRAMFYYSINGVETIKDIMEFTPDYIKSKKFDALTQYLFSRAVKELNDSEITCVKLERINDH